MSGKTRRAEATEEQRRRPEVMQCPDCGQRLCLHYTTWRKVVTLDGMLRLKVSIGRCEKRYDELVALSVRDSPERCARLAVQGRVILAIDGLQPDVGQEVLWVIREVLSGEVLLARSLLSSRQADLVVLLHEAVAGLEVPVVGVISKGQQSIGKAVAEAFPGVHHQLCQFHYWKQAVGPAWEADRHAKKELKKRVRGIRPLERAIGERELAFQQIHAEMAQRGEDGWSVAFTDAVGVFTKDDIQAPVPQILHAPVPAHGVSEAPRLRRNGVDKKRRSML